MLFRSRAAGYFYTKSGFLLYLGFFVVYFASRFPGVFSSPSPVYFLAILVYFLYLWVFFLYLLVYFLYLWCFFYPFGVFLIPFVRGGAGVFSIPLCWNPGGDAKAVKLGDDDPKAGGGGLEGKEGSKAKQSEAKRSKAKRSKAKQSEAKQTSNEGGGS